MSAVIGNADVAAMDAEVKRMLGRMKAGRDCKGAASGAGIERGVVGGGHGVRGALPGLLSQASDSGRDERNLQSDP